MLGWTKKNHGRLEQYLKLGLFKYEAGVLTHFTSMFSPRAVGYPYCMVTADFKFPHITGPRAGFVLKGDSTERWKNIMLTTMDSGYEITKEHKGNITTGNGFQIIISSVLVHLNCQPKFNSMMTFGFKVHLLFKIEGF